MLAARGHIEEILYLLALMKSLDNPDYHEESAPGENSRILVVVRDKPEIYSGRVINTYSSGNSNYDSGHVIILAVEPDIENLLWGVIGH